MADEAVLGLGAKFYLHDGSSLIEMDGVVGVNPPNPTVDTIDTTHHGSANGVRTFMAGLLDPGELKIRLFWSPGSTTDTKLSAAVAARTQRAFKVVVVETDGTTQDLTGNCIPTGYEHDDVVIDDKMTAVFSAKVSGAVTQAASS